MIGTVASQAYSAQLRGLADSAISVGFGCVAVAAMDPFAALLHPSIFELPAPPERLLPRTKWCKEWSAEYGWRRSGFYRSRMWRLVLESGYDLFAVDCDWRLLWSPVPHIHLRMPTAVDVVAFHDGPQNKLLNVGLMWVRNTNVSRVLSVLAENRTFDEAMLAPWNARMAP